MEINKLLETVADFSYIMGRSNYYSGNSRADIKEAIYWSIDFEIINKNTDWNKNDYILEIEKYTTKKIAKLRALYNY